MTTEQEIERIKENQKQLEERVKILEQLLHLTQPPIIKTTDKSVQQPHVIKSAIQPKTAIQTKSDYKNMEETTKTEIKYTAPKNSLNFSEFKLSQLINRIGVVVLVLGIAMFLKYSFDNHWISESGRIVISLLAGLTLWGGGEYTRKKYPVYSQGLTGGGSLTMYLAIYAGYDFYHLYSPALTFVLLIGVMVLTVSLAIRQNALAIGILGIIGGYVAPFLVGSENPSPWTLFTYLLILTCGVTGVSYYKKWDIFNILSFAFNQFVLLTWLFSDNLDQYKTPTFIFISCLLVLYIGITSIYNIRNKISSNNANLGLISSNATAFFVWSYLILRTGIVGEYMGFYAILIAIIYALIGKFGYNLNKKDEGQILTLFGISIVLTTIAIPLQVKDSALAIGWFVEALCLVYTGFRLNNNKLRFSGCGVYILGLLTALKYVPSIVNNQTFLLNNPTYVMLVGIVVTGLISILYHKNKSNIKESEEIISFLPKGLLYVGILLFIAIENNHFFAIYYPQNSLQFYSLSLLWLVYGELLLLLGFKYSDKYVRFGSIGVVALSLLVGFASTDNLFYEKSFILNFPTISLLFLLLGTYSFMYSYKILKYKLSKEEEHLGNIFKYSLLTEIFAVLSILNTHFFALYNYNSSAEQISLSFVWLIYGIILVSFGFKKNDKNLRYSGLGLLAVVLVKAFLVDLSFLATVYRIILFVVIGLVLLGVSLVYQKKQAYFEDKNE